MTTGPDIRESIGRTAIPDSLCERVMVLGVDLGSWPWPVSPVIKYVPCRVGLVVSVSASHTVGNVFVSRPGHTKDHHKNGTSYLSAWHAMR